MPSTVVEPVSRASRAVTRLVEPGSGATCARCNEPVKFTARRHDRQVIANVYERGRWVRVEHFHEECYEEAGWPYGDATFGTPARRKAG